MNILMIMDLNMKRRDQFDWLKIGAYNKDKVDVILPIKPCDELEQEFKKYGVSYTVIKKWRRIPYDATSKKSNIKLAFYILFAKKFWNYDVIDFHFCSEITVLITNILLKFFPGKHVIVWHQHSEIRGTKTFILLRILKKFFFRLKILSYFIDAICVDYKGARELLIGKGIEARKLFCTYPGVDIEKFDVSQQEKDRIINEFKLSLSDTIITCVASLILRKGHIYLVKAAKILMEKFPEAKFIFVGDGSTMFTLKELVHRLDLEEHIIFAGSRRSIPILAISDIFVLPTLSEAFPIAILEAMASGLPIVASRVAGIPEQVRDGENGFLVPPKDFMALSRAITKLLVNPELAKKMGRKGRDTVEEKFTLNTMFENYRHVYMKCLDQK